MLTPLRAESDSEKSTRMAQLKRALARSMETLKPGDRFRASRCGGIRAWYRFSHWDGDELITASGIYDIHPINIDRLNGEPVSFDDPEVVS